MLEIKPINSKQILEILKIHKTSFVGFFLTDLGDDFLIEYYNSVINNADGLIFGAFVDNDLVGFCSATKLSKGFNKALIKENLIKFSIIAFKLGLFKPSALIRLYKNLTKKNPKINDNGEYAEILSLAVCTSYQNRGIGKKLIENLEQELAKLNCTKLSLTTDVYNNKRTINFYSNLGYLVLYEFTSWPKRRMYRMIKIIK